MKVQLANGMTKRVKVGDQLPFGNPVVKVTWTEADILPDPDKFHTYMKETLQAAMVLNNKVSIVFTAEVQ